MSSAARIALVGVGALTLLSRGVVVGMMVRKKRELSDRWTGENKVVLVAVVGPFFLFGLVLVVVGLWPELKALLWVGAAVLVLAIPARRLLARRLYGTEP